MFSSSRVLICLSGLVLDSIWFLSHFSLLGAFRSQFLESGFLFLARNSVLSIQTQCHKAMQ